VAELAIRLGGHVRVGFEDNLYDVDGELLENNEARVRQVAELAARAGRPLATPSQIRGLFAAQDAAY
jgi:3-keto-5-aminohexanoate cleavage enzyme